MKNKKLLNQDELSFLIKKYKSKWKVITLATAHPAKFPEAVLKATGVNPELPERLKFITKEKENYFNMSNSVNEVKNFIKERGKF